MSNGGKFVYAMRMIGKGLSYANMFCLRLDLPSPLQKNHQCTVIVSELLSILKACTQEAINKAYQFVCMNKAIEEAVAEIISVGI